MGAGGLELEERPGREWGEVERDLHRSSQEGSHSRSFNTVGRRGCATCLRKEGEIGISEEEANWVPAELAR